MPETRDMTERRAGQQLTLTGTAIDDYRNAGWHITEHGRPDLGTTNGPCTRCQATTARYGPTGQPLCADCRHPKESSC